MVDSTVVVEVQLLNHVSQLRPSKQSLNIHVQEVVDASLQFSVRKLLSCCYTDAIMGDTLNRGASNGEAVYSTASFNSAGDRLDLSKSDHNFGDGSLALRHGKYLKTNHSILAFIKPKLST